MVFYVQSTIMVVSGRDINCHTVFKDKAAFEEEKKVL